MNLWYVNCISIKKKVQGRKRGWRISCVSEKIALFSVPLCILDFKTGQQYLLLILESCCNSAELRKLDKFVNLPASYEGAGGSQFVLEFFLKISKKPQSF